MQLSGIRKTYFAISAVLFGAFIFFSYLTAKETFTEFDFDTTVRVQDKISTGWDASLSVFSLLGQAEVTGAIWLALVAWAVLKRYWLTVVGLSLLVVTQIIELFGKYFLHHPGPPFLFYRGIKIIEFPSYFIQTNYSYPSGHSTRAAFLITFLFVVITLKGRGVSKIILQAFLGIFLIMMLVTRVSLGEHWATDVIGGALLGVSFGIFAAITIPAKRSSPVSDVE